MEEEEVGVVGERDGACVTAVTVASAGLEDAFLVAGPAQGTLQLA